MICTMNNELNCRFETISSGRATNAVANWLIIDEKTIGIKMRRMIQNNRRPWTFSMKRSCKWIIWGTILSTAAYTQHILMKNLNDVSSMKPNNGVEVPEEHASIRDETNCCKQDIDGRHLLMVFDGLRRCSADSALLLDWRKQGSLVKGHQKATRQTKVMSVYIHWNRLRRLMRRGITAAKLQWK